MLTKKFQGLIASLALVIIFPATNIFAAGGCSLSNGASKEISAYQDALNTVLDKIRSEAGKSTCNTKNDSARASSSARTAFSEIIKYSNIAFTQDDYKTSWEFSLNMVLRSEIPPAVRTHHQILLNMQQTIQSTMETVYDRCASDVSVLRNDYIPTENATMRSTLSEIVGELLSSHITLINFYRKTTTGTPADPVTPLVWPKTFASDLESSHWPKAIEACNKEWSVWDRVGAAIKKITSKGGSIAKGTQEWKDAWKLLKSETGFADRKSAETTKENLSKDGIPAKENDSFFSTAGKYLTQDKQRGLGGFVNDLGIQTAKTFRTVSGIYDDFATILKDSGTTDEFVQKYANVQFLQTDLSKEIVEDNARLLNTIGDENITNDAKVAHYVGIYKYFDTISNRLAGKRKIATAACEGQWQNKGGNCTGGSKR